jgi:hypothetical protein
MGSLPLIHHQNKEFKPAIELYEKAIALGRSSAMYNRALMHEKGQGGDVNFNAAIELGFVALLTILFSVGRSRQHDNFQASQG